MAHSYYQVACIFWLLFALAVLLGGTLEGHPYHHQVAVAGTSLLAVVNLGVFAFSYMYVEARAPEKFELSRHAYLAGNFLRENTPEGSGIIVFNQDWSSEVAFHAQRKSMTVPEWFHLKDSVWQQPQQFLGDITPSGISICPIKNTTPNKSDIAAFLKENPDWEVRYLDDCAFLLRTAISEEKISGAN